MRSNYARGVSLPTSARLLLALTALIGSILAALVGCGGGGGGGGDTVTAPTIVTHPASVTVATGASASFSVTATGSSLSYQWFKVNDSSGNGEAISGATSSTYTIASAQPSHVAAYYVVVTNSAGSDTSNQATLTLSDNSGDATVIVD